MAFHDMFLLKREFDNFQFFWRFIIFHSAKNILWKVDVLYGFLHWVTCFLEVANYVSLDVFLKICFHVQIIFIHSFFIFDRSSAYGDVSLKQNCWDKTIRAKVVFLILNLLIACYNQTVCIGNLLTVLPDSFVPLGERYCLIVTFLIIIVCQKLSIMLFSFSFDL